MTDRTIEPQAHRQPRTRHAFTLVEMLAVVAIVALLLFIGLPMFHSFGTRSLASANTSVAATVRLARQYAVTKRTETWVIFPDGRNAPYVSRGEISKAAVAYAVIASNRESGKIEYISDWRFLPKGVAFLTNATVMAEDTVFNSYSSGSDRSTRFPLPSDNSPSQYMSAIMFRPTGQCMRYLRDSQRWSVGDVPNRSVIPLTTARFVDVDTNAGSMSAYRHIPGSTNFIVISGMTGQAIIMETEK